MLGVDDRSALSVIRSLGRKGITVHQGSDYPESICQYSRYNKKIIPLPNAGTHPELWIKELVDLLNREKYDLVIPTADNYLVLVVKHREKLEQLARFAIPDNKGFLYTYQKNKTMELAAELGVPCPKSLEISSPTEIDQIIKEFEFPVIIKPVSSKVWKDSRRHNLAVELVSDVQLLPNILEKTLSISPVLIQSFHQGIGIGQEFLVNNGRVVQAFQHERVHEPLGGGGSSYRKSARINRKLLGYSTRMLEALKWNGVAMVEYKYNKKTHESVLMEINGRFWGSLPLAMASGVDFPFLLYNMLVHDRLSIFGTENKENYKINIYCRNITKDLDWFKENVKADESDPYKITYPNYKIFGEVLNLLKFSERYDTIVTDDLKPGLYHISRYLLENFRGMNRKLKTGFIRFNLGKNFIQIWLRKRKLAKLIKSSQNVNFVCKGNICRSPFAEHYLRSKLKEKNLNHFKVESTGLIQNINRKSPDAAIETARLFGIDLFGHLSKVLIKEDITGKEIFFVMDSEIYLDVRAQYPELKDRLFFLGELRKGYPKLIDIADPYGHQTDFFRKIYCQISQSLDQLITLINNKAHN